MPNPLQSYVNTNRIIATYQKIKGELGLDYMVFSAMKAVAQRKGIPFDLPESPAQYSQKHQEIEQHLTRYPNLLNRHGLFFELMEEIHSQLAGSGQVVHSERFRKLVILEIDNDFKINLSADGAWLIEWDISINVAELSDARSVFTSIYKSSWEHIVPWHVVQYLNSGVFLYKQKAYATALALMSIAVESTLRDILSTKGYGFVPGASRIDIYKCSEAQLDINGTGYSLVFPDGMPKGVSDLPASASGVLPIGIKIRRTINDRARRTDLTIVNPPSYLLDHLSGNQIEQHGQPKSIAGLGEALMIARNTESVITPSDLPIDVDDVLQAVRNNLIHLSSDSMDKELPQYAFKSSTGRFTVKDFVNDPALVFDLVTDIPRFVNDQYVKLWKAGERI